MKSAQKRVVVAESASDDARGFHIFCGKFFRRDAFPVRLHKEFGLQRDYPFLIRDLISGMQMLTLADKLSCPALFCYGSADGLAPADQGQLLATECPESTFLIFPGETHFTTPLSRTFEKEVIHWIRHKAITPTGKAKVT